MKILRQGVCLALLGAGLAAVPGLQATAATTSTVVAGESLVQQMRNEARGSVALSTERATGKVGFIRSGNKGDLFPAVEGDSLRGAVDKTTAYLKQYGAAFGARAGELSQSGVTSSPLGWTVSFKQSYKGVPVFGSLLKANVDKAGDLTSVSGYAAPDLNLNVTPRFSAATAASRAIATVRANPPGEGGADVSGLKATRNDLVVYRMGATKGDAGRAILAHQVEVSNERNVRDMVFINASTGKMVNRYSMVHGFETDRELYEADEERNLNLVWKDGDPYPGGLNSAQQDLVVTAGNSYWLFANTFGRDSYDGEGATMITVNNDPAIECPNANWNGVTTNYCNGVTSDDVVAHEWGHAYTEYTSGLIYQWQSGALNESYSDVWGETVDLINNRDDAGEGDTATPRPDGLCSTNTRGHIGMTINSPASIAGPCDAAPAAWGPVFDKTGVTTDIVVGEDGDTYDGGASTTTDGCTAFTNAAEVDGNFAYVDRGLCTFQEKVDNAEAAGATGLVVGNHTAGEAPFSMSGTSAIYGLMVDVETGAKIKAATETVNATIKDIDTEEKADSFRWLVSEKSSAFGGAIRDMWNPTCYGDPGKVSDVEYKCSTDDSGGVHSNSGVPNHAYSLLVDGGTYNGTTVEGIGLDKAANIYWRTQTAHLTPTSDFVDMADGLDASCQELIGQEILSLNTKRETPGTVIDPITPADCIMVAAASDAVELRFDPTEQCDFQPLLNPNAPAACGKEFNTRTVWKEDFEDGLQGWRKSERLFDFNGDGNPPGHGFDWRATTNAPNHGSRTAFAPDPGDGDCQGGSNDVSSANAITSGKIVVKKGARKARMNFDHYMASESGWDGGNVKISVNGGKFKVIPRKAYLFNAPNGHLFTLNEGNSNPMAGEAAFTGTNGGEVFGSWGESQIKLGEAGVGNGDKFKIRFDMGRDGCGGVDGWYVDNVKVVRCIKKGTNNKLATKQ